MAHLVEVEEVFMEEAEAEVTLMEEVEVKEVLIMETEETLEVEVISEVEVEVDHTQLQLNPTQLVQRTVMFWPILIVNSNCSI